MTDSTGIDRDQQATAPRREPATDILQDWVLQDWMLHLVLVAVVVGGLVASVLNGSTIA
jgi:hypothetical protein